MSQIPTIGRIVHYKLSEHDADVVRFARLGPGGFSSAGNEVKAGMVFPATIVAVWGDTEAACCNLQVFLDGPDVHWATSRSADLSGEHREGFFVWPERK